MPRAYLPMSGESSSLDRVVAVWPFIGHSGVVRRVALSLAVLAAVLSAGSAPAATAPFAKEKRVAAKRLFAFVYPMSYVIDYRITDCTREGATVTCGYKVGFYSGESCTGTISVEAAGRRLIAKIGGPPPALTFESVVAVPV